MKILITTDWYTPAINGVVSSVLNLRRELQLRGHEVRVLTLAPSTSSFEQDGVVYIGSISMGKIYPGARLKTDPQGEHIQKLIDWKPDIIHSQCELSTFLLARKISKRCNIPLVHTYHTVYENYTHYFSPNEEWGRQIAAIFSRWALNKVSCIIAPTEKVRHILLGYGIIPKIHVIPSGLDLSSFSRRTYTEQLALRRKELDIPDENYILLYVGRLAKEKNLEEIFTYYAKLEREDLSLLVAGDGPHKDSLIALAEDLGIQKKVIFTGMIDPSIIPQFYQIGDLFVSASNSETQGITYIEALASGLPALCRKDSCLDGIIFDGLNGWQYEDEVHFFSCLNLFFTDKNLRKEMSLEAEKLGQEVFSAASFAEKVECVYFETIQQKSNAENSLHQSNLCQTAYPTK